MTNKPEWMLSYFREKIEDVFAENPNQSDAIDSLAHLLTRYALMPPDAAKNEVQNDD